MLPAHARLATLAPMSKGTTEIASGAVRDIEPELRELFTKVVERDPREAVKMLEPYPDEFVVKMLELLNPAATLKILQRFDLSRRETILATASTETTQQWMRNQTYPERTVGRLMQPPLAVFRPTTTVGRSYGANSPAREKNDYHLRVRDGRTGQTSWGSGHARHATGATRATLRRDHAAGSVLSNARYVVDHRR